MPFTLGLQTCKIAVKKTTAPLFIVVSTDNFTIKLANEELGILSRGALVRPALLDSLGGVEIGPRRTVCKWGVSCTGGCGLPVMDDQINLLLNFIILTVYAK